MSISRGTVRRGYRVYPVVGLADGERRTQQASVQDTFRFKRPPGSAESSLLSQGVAVDCELGVGTVDRSQ